MKGAHRKTKKCITLSLPFILAFSFFALIGCDRKSGSGNPDAKQALRAVEVTAVTIAPKTIPVTFEAVGQTAGSREVEVRARVGGILLRRFYDEGEFVKQGTLLFKIDPAPYQATLNRLKGILEQEEAQLDKAVRDEARLKPLVASNAVKIGRASCRE